MTARIDDASNGHSIREVLAAGWRLFRDGFGSAFPWVLAAELLQLLPLGDQSQGSFDLNADVSSYFQPGYFGRELLVGLAQAMLYAVAVLRLAALAGERPKGNTAWNALRAMPSVFVGYLAYSLLVIVGLGFSLILFLNILPLGAGPAVAFVLIPLVPTAIASTALALFVYPAVLERRGPFAALRESARLAKSSWARVTAVISVPALFMMFEWAVNNGIELWKILSAAFGALTQGEGEGVSEGDLQKAVESALHTVGGDHNLVWQVIGAVLAAIVWWYAVAVCYAQYRDLKRSKPD